MRKTSNEKMSNFSQLFIILVSLSLVLLFSDQFAYANPVTEHHNVSSDVNFDFVIVSFTVNYEVNFDTKHPETLVLGEYSELVITPKRAETETTVKWINGELPPIPQSLEVGQKKNIPIISGKIPFTSAYLSVSASSKVNVIGPATISQSEISWDNSQSKTLEITLNEDFGDHDSITIQLPIEGVLNLGVGYDIFVSGDNFDVKTVSQPMSPIIEIEIPIKKFVETDLELRVSNTETAGNVMIKPILTDEDGNELLFEVGISVDGIFKKKVKANEWSEEFFIGSGEKRFVVEFLETPNPDKKSIVYEEAESTSYYLVRTEGEPLGEEYCGEGTTFEDGKCVKVDEGGGCLIATATYGTELASQVQQLRELRDNVVLSTTSGTAFMSTFNQIYYSFSPTIADWERENPFFREAVKFVITPMISSLSILNHLNIDSEAEMIGYGLGVSLMIIGIYVATPYMVFSKIKKHYSK